MEKYMGCGIYAIINKKLNLVYIGQTKASFVLRWAEQLHGAPRQHVHTSHSLLQVDEFASTFKIE